MDFLNKINEFGTDIFNKGTRFAGAAIESAGPAVKDAIKNVGKGVVDYVKDIPSMGAIPVPSPSPTARTALGYIKSTAGPIGMPIRILDNPKSSEFYQKTVDAADFNPETNEVIFNQNIKNKDAYDELGQNFSNKDFGRYVGKVGSDGTVMVEDDYDTNRSVPWHLKKVFSIDMENPVGLTDRAISGASAINRGLDDVGWTNKRPFGKTVKMGVKN